jgi:uncharacterized protein YjcR
MVPPTGAIAQINRLMSNINDTASDRMGAKGHRVEDQVYCSSNRLRFWTRRAEWKRKEVSAMTAQFVKKEALVMETSQLRTM